MTIMYAQCANTIAITDCLSHGPLYRWPLWGVFLLAEGEVVGQVALVDMSRDASVMYWLGSLL
jgi:hypothetical protein